VIKCEGGSRVSNYCEKRKEGSGARKNTTKGKNEGKKKMIKRGIGKYGRSKGK